MSSVWGSEERMWSYSLHVSFWSLWWCFTFRFKMWVIWFWNKTYSRKALVKWISGSVEESDFAQSCFLSVLSIVSLGQCTLVILTLVNKQQKLRFQLGNGIEAPRGFSWRSKNPKAHTMPFCSLPRHVACVWLLWKEASRIGIRQCHFGLVMSLWEGNLSYGDDSGVRTTFLTSLFHWTEGI